jgi:hypothetical protein
MKLNGRDVTQRRLLLVGTTTIASLGVGMMTVGQAQADTPTSLASSTAATAVVTDPQDATAKRRPNKSKSGRIDCRNGQGRR